MSFLSFILLTAVKVILLLNEIKNSIPFAKNIFAVINTSLWILMSLLGILRMFPATWIGFFPVIFPFKSAIFLLQIEFAISISWTVTCQSMICWLWKINLKYLTDGYPSLEYRVFACSAPLICLLGNLLVPLPYQLDYNNEVHICASWIPCFFLILSMHNKYLVNAIICYSICLIQVFECNYISYSIFDEQQILFICWHCCLVCKL